MKHGTKNSTRVEIEKTNLELKLYNWSSSKFCDELNISTFEQNKQNKYTQTCAFNRKNSDYLENNCSAR
jgi:hypothetical protein